jgi:hypothetical protein
MEPRNDGTSEINRGGYPPVGVAAVEQQGSRTDSSGHKRHPLITRFLRWLYPDQRKTNRLTVPNLIAFLGSVRNSQGYDVSDVSAAGFYMVTKERWIPGTVLPVTLLRTRKDAKDLDESITLQSCVVRAGPDGVGFEFVLSENMASDKKNRELGSSLEENQLEKFLQGLKLSTSDETGLMWAS